MREGGGREGSYFAVFFHCRRVVCAVLSRLFGTVSLCNKLQTQKKGACTRTRARVSDVCRVSAHFGYIFGFLVA